MTWPPRLITVLTDSPKHPVDVDQLSSTLAKAFPIAVRGMNSVSVFVLQFSCER